MSDYRVWGIRSDNSRDLVGMVKADGMGEAVRIVAAMPKPVLDYPGMIIEKMPALGDLPWVWPGRAMSRQEPKNPIK